MPEVTRSRFSYRKDRAVPTFDDSRALFVFDGVCVLCSGGAKWIMRHDRKMMINFTPAQGALGQALYAHYGVEMDESYLLVADGRAYTCFARLHRTVQDIGRLVAHFPRRDPETHARLVLCPHCPQPLSLVRESRLLRAANPGAASPPLMNR
jgi:hypothetical protein